VFRVASTAETFWKLRGLLWSWDSFVYTRVGDGEMEIALGGSAAYHCPNPELGREITGLMQAQHKKNLVALAMHDTEPGMEPGLFEGWHNLRYDGFKFDRMFENAIALHMYAVFRPAILRQLFDLIRDRPKVVVTSQTGNLTPLVGRHQLCLIPERNAYQSIDSWYPQLEGHELILFAAGPAKCAASLRLLESGWAGQALDIGSVVDFALDEPTHTWIRMANERFPGSRKVLLVE
jgi:hypothetical protein